MKILYVATSFPKPNKGATIYTDLAEALHQAGHKISIAVSEQASNQKNTTFEKERGFDVLRIVTGNYYDVSLLKKGIATLQIPFIMKGGIAKYYSDNEFDIVLYEAPPVTNSDLIAWIKKKFSCRSFLMLKDIFPQNGVDIGIIKENSLVFKYFKYKEHKLYKVSDYIGCMSKGNRDYVIKNNSWLNQNKVAIFPNTKAIAKDYKESDNDIRKKYNIPDDVCLFLFGGNMGRPQCIDLLAKTIVETKNNSKLHYLFAGRGTDRYKLEEAIENNNINNATVIENLPRDEYEKLTMASDVGLIVLDPRFTIPNYPSRILSYMEYAKPVIAATDSITDYKELIQDSKCGLWVESANPIDLIKTIEEMANRTDRKLLGENGRKYMESHFHVSKSVELIEDFFEKGI